MADISVIDKQLLEDAFNMNNGYVLDFSDKTFSEYFMHAFNIDINAPEYLINGTSKANKLRTFWKIADKNVVAQSIEDMADLVINKDFRLLTNGWVSPDARQIMNARRAMMDQVKGVAEKIRNKTAINSPKRKLNPGNTSIEIFIHPDIYTHISQYLVNNDMFHAVEEAYKFVRQKLRDLTKCERAIEVFCPSAENTKYWETLFGTKPENGTPEYDFCRGVGYLHLGIQFLRNEKAHTPAQDLEPNLAYHYIALASLAYELISRNSAE